MVFEEVPLTKHGNLGTRCKVMISTGANNLSSKGLKLFRVCADYRPHNAQDIEYTYAVCAIGMRDARRKWIETYPWLKILDIREATEEENKEYETDVPTRLQGHLAIWRPRSEGGEHYWSSLS